MIDIPANVHILTTIKRGTVYYFREENFSSVEPHYFVVLNKNPSNNSVIILVCATSQIEKRKRRAQILNFPIETLVEVSPSDFSLFSKNTIFDCNCVIEKNVQSIIDKLSKKQLIICSTQMPEKIMSLLVAGVLRSSQISEQNKKIIES